MSKSKQNKVKEESLAKMKLIVVLLVCLFAISAVEVAKGAPTMSFQLSYCKTYGVYIGGMLCDAICKPYKYRWGYCHGASICTCVKWSNQTI